MPETLNFFIDDILAGQRLDKALVALCPDLSRARVQSLIDQGHVVVNGSSSAASYRVKTGDSISIHVPDAVIADPVPQDIALDILYEDDDILVLNKPAGLVVHPGAGHHDQTLVNALLHHCGESLSGIGGVKRPGIVHRLDKDTSGLMLVAKNDVAHQSLSQQLQDRAMSRTYWAVVLGQPVPVSGLIDLPIGRHPTHRQKQAIVKTGRAARTHYKVIETFNQRFSLVECRLETGRTHQIRIHMMTKKYPLIGDLLYGPAQTAVKAALRYGAEDAGAQQVVTTFPRQALHARRLAFQHPRTQADMSFETLALPDDLAELLSSLRRLFLTA